MDERQIALYVLESLREDLIYAHLNNGSRLLFVTDFRQYIYEQMGRLRTHAIVMDRLYGNDIRKGNVLKWERASIEETLARATAKERACLTSNPNRF